MGERTLGSRHEDVRVKAAGLVEELEVEGGGGLAVDGADGDGHVEGCEGK